MLGELTAVAGLDWSKVTMFHLDEYIGLAPGQPPGFGKYLKERFVDKVENLKAAHFVDGNADDPQQECKRIGELIKERAIDVALIGIGALVLYSSLWASFDDFTTSIDHCSRAFCDFGDCYYPMAEQILESPRPVEGCFYSPFFALLLKPFALLHLAPATCIWGGLSISISLLLMAAPFALMGGKRNGYALMSVALFLSCYPVLHNFKWGQVSALMTLLILVAFWLLAKKMRARAGMLLGLAASIKFYPALFLAWVLLKRDWKSVAAFGMTCALLLGLIPITVLGWDETLTFYTALGDSLARLSVGHGDINSQAVQYVSWRWVTVFGDPEKVEGAFPALLHAPLIALGKHPALIEHGLRWVGRLVLVLNGLVTLLIWRRRWTNSPLWFFCFASLSIPFLVATSWPHYFVFLPFCQIFLLSQVFGNVRSTLLRVLSLLLLWLPSVLLVNIVFFHLVGNWRIYNGLGAIFVSTLLLNALALLVIARKFKPVKAFRVS